LVGELKSSRVEEVKSMEGPEVNRKRFSGLKRPAMRAPALAEVNSVACYLYSEAKTFQMLLCELVVFDRK
jgi:hypothetical protein